MKSFFKYALLSALLSASEIAAGADYYTASGDPATGSALSSSVLRSEYSAIGLGFTKIAPYTGNGNKAVIINSSGTGQTVTTGTLGLAGNFSTVGAYSMALTATAATAVTLPTTGTLSTLAGAEALTNKTINGNTITSGTGTLTLGGTSKTVSFADAFSTSGAYSIALTATAGTTLTLPITGTLATLAGSEELTNKTLTASVGKGTWTASGTWTLPAMTFGGAITGSGSPAMTGMGAYNKITVTQPATGSTLTLIDGSTLATSGAHSITLTSTADTTVTLPTTGTLATTAGNVATATALATPRAINGVNFDGTAAITVTAAASTLSGSTLASGVTASSLTSLGTITTLTATTINAFTLGGTVSGGGNNINNVIIGAVTPLAGNFTTIGASGTVTIGSGSTTSQGWAIGYLGSSGNSGLWTTAVTASTSNYSLAASSTSTVVNAATTLNLSIANSNIVAVSSAGAAVTGTFSSTGAAQASTTLAVGGSGLNNSAFAVNGTGKTNFATFSDFTTTTLTIAGSSGVVTLTPTTTLAIGSGTDLQLGRAYSAGVVSATGTIAIKDSTGTTYNVLVHN